MVCGVSCHNDSQLKERQVAHLPFAIGVHMQAEIIATGDEIRTGALVDTNTAFLARELEELGIEVVRHSTAGDNLDALSALFAEAGQRADVVLVTGGLGPTSDDVTAAAAAKAAGVPVELNDTALKMIESYFNSRNRVLQGANLKQAQLPKGCEVLPNTQGTAPGFSLMIGKARFFFTPGVPPEMKAMYTNDIASRLLAMQGGDTMQRKVWICSCFGLGESTVYERLVEFDKLFPDLILGFRASIPIVEVKIYANGQDIAKLETRLAEASQWVLERLEGYVYAHESASLAQVVGNILNAQNATLAVAESCTGGLIASQITDISGSSAYFLLSAVTYANEAKTSVLGVKTETLMEFGAVSEATAREMAEGARKAVNATYGLATTGIAGPTGGTPEKPVGTICIAVSGPNGTVSCKINRDYGERLRNKSMFAALALDMLRRVMLGEEELKNFF